MRLGRSAAYCSDPDGPREPVLRSGGRLRSTRCTLHVGPTQDARPIRAAAPNLSQYTPSQTQSQANASSCSAPPRSLHALHHWTASRPAPPAQWPGARSAQVDDRQATVGNRPRPFEARRARPVRSGTPDPYRNDGGRWLAVNDRQAMVPKPPISVGARHASPNRAEWRGNTDGATVPVCWTPLTPARWRSPPPLPHDRGRGGRGHTRAASVYAGWCGNGFGLPGLPARLGQARLTPTGTTVAMRGGSAMRA